jgi:hypothetical protein
MSRRVRVGRRAPVPATAMDLGERPSANGTTLFLRGCPLHPAGGAGCAQPSPVSVRAVRGRPQPLRDAPCPARPGLEAAPMTQQKLKDPAQAAFRCCRLLRRRTSQRNGALHPSAGPRRRARRLLLRPDGHHRHRRPQAARTGAAPGARRSQTRAGLRRPRRRAPAEVLARVAAPACAWPGVRAPGGRHAVADAAGTGDSSS